MSFARAAITLLPLAFLGLAACSSDAVTGTGSTTTPPPVNTPVSGYLTVGLATPHSDDGAVQLSVQGPAIDSVKLVSYQGFASVQGGVANVLVTGSVGSGVLARIYVPDVSQASAYSATVAAAAARGTYALQALDGYRVTVAR